MNLFYENQGNNTYLVYEIGENDELDTMSLGMLTNNTIPGFAPTTFTQMDTTRYIKYNVSSKISVAQLFAGAVNKKRLVGVFTGIVDAMLSAEDYMLDPDNMLLELDYIFADVSTCETEVVCLPIMNAERKHKDLGAFFKNILFTTQFDQTENCDHVAQLLNYLNSSPILSLGGFKELLERIGQSAPAPRPVAAQPVAAQPAKPIPAQPVAAQPARPIPAQPVAAQPVAKPVAAQPVIPQPVAKPVAAQPVQPPVVNTPAAEAPKEKEMSMFYLLQHYNKENAAIYKAQQDAKKAKDKKPAAPAPEAPKADKKKAAAPKNVGFAIPGQQSAPNVGFAVPGQSQAPAAPKPVQPAIPQPVAKPIAAKPVAPQPAPQPAAPVYQPPVPQPSAPISFGETTVLSAGIGETTVLGTVTATVQNDPHLIRAKNNEKIPLNKPVFRIGKERSFVDYFIGDNTAISRSHANIVSRDGEYFVVDTNSTNHTYVNGGMISSNVEVKLSHGAKIRLGNEDFEFKMY